MKTLMAILILISSSAWSISKAAVKPEAKKTLKILFDRVNHADQEIRVEENDVVLKDYTLLVMSSLRWEQYAVAENMWEKLAHEKMKKLNVIVIYDGFGENQRESNKLETTKIKNKSRSSNSTNMYEYLDYNRLFYYWFPSAAPMNAVLISFNDKILFEGVVNSQAKIEEIKALIK